MTISWEDFEKIELVSGTIIHAEDFPEARKSAYKLQIDLGNGIIKKSSAQITDLYRKEDLIGKQVMCVSNFPPRQIGPFMSEVLVTGFYTDQGVVLAVPDPAIGKIVGNGLKLG